MTYNPERYHREPIRQDARPFWPNLWRRARPRQRPDRRRLVAAHNARVESVWSRSSRCPFGSPPGRAAAGRADHDF